MHRPSNIGERYRARLKKRSPGHLGASYVPELIELADGQGRSGTIRCSTSTRSGRSIFRRWKNGWSVPWRSERCLPVPGTFVPPSNDPVQSQLAKWGSARSSAGFAESCTSSALSTPSNVLNLGSPSPINAL